MSVEEKMVEEPKWYVIHTYSSYEAMVKDSLEKLIENNNLQEIIFEGSAPEVEFDFEEKVFEGLENELKLFYCGNIILGKAAVKLTVVAQNRVNHQKGFLRLKPSYYIIYAIGLVGR